MINLLSLAKSLVTVCIMNSLFFAVFDELITDSLITDLTLALFFIPMFKLILIISENDIPVFRNVWILASVVLFFMTWNQCMRQVMISTADYIDIQEVNNRDLRYTKYIRKSRESDGMADRFNIYKPIDYLNKSTQTCRTKSFISKPINPRSSGRWSSTKPTPKAHRIEVCVFSKYKDFVFISHNNTSDDDRYYRVYDPRYKDMILGLAENVNTRESFYVLFKRVNSVSEISDLVDKILICMLMFSLVMITTHFYANLKGD